MRIASEKSPKAVKAGRIAYPCITVLMLALAFESVTNTVFGEYFVWRGRSEEHPWQLSFYGTTMSRASAEALPVQDPPWAQFVIVKKSEGHVTYIMTALFCSVGYLWLRVFRPSWILTLYLGFCSLWAVFLPESLTEMRYSHMLLALPDPVLAILDPTVLVGILGAVTMIAVNFWVILSVSRWRPLRLPRFQDCRHCKYDLTGNVSGICPECGQSIPDEQKMFLDLK